MRKRLEEQSDVVGHHFGRLRARTMVGPKIDDSGTSLLD
jgi:hypothetical protein